MWPVAGLWGRGGEGGAGAPQTCSAPPPGTRVRPCMCYVKDMMKRQKRSYIVSSSDQLSRIRSSTDSDCTRTHLRGPRIKKNFWGSMPPDPPHSSVLEPPLCVDVQIPLKVQISCNLAPCHFNNNRLPRLHEEPIPRTGNRKFIWSGLKPNETGATPTTIAHLSVRLTTVIAIYKLPRAHLYLPVLLNR